MTPNSRPDHGVDPAAAALVGATFAAAVLGALLWAGGALACLLTRRPVPHGRLLAGLRTLAHPDAPSRGWRAPMPGPVSYWTVTALVLIVAVAVVLAVVRLCRRVGTSARTRMADRPGLATRGDVRANASAAALQRRAHVLRPSLDRPDAHELGYQIGTAHGIPVWTSVEDSVVIVGPPRSGKGLHLVIPMLLDAPGPVITTSTRPDNVTATLAARSAAGDVAVFDPQGLAPGIRDGLKWSPIRGCDDPQTAMIRARALAGGASDQVENRGFWQAQTESALRAFLHGAALGGLTAADLYRWSLDPAAAAQAVRILNAHAGAAPGWADALDAIISGDPRTRDNSWAGVRIALSCLADPRVLAAVTPDTDRPFEPDRFLTGHGTLYLLGTASGAGAASNLVAALIEDIVEVARRRAAQAAQARLDPPLALILDEAANYALPSLPALISEGGGTGVTTIAVLQTLAQARARWGEHDGAAIWDAASVKIILGGGSNARDLNDLAALIGDRDDRVESVNRDADGRRSSSTSIRRVPILDTATLRTLPFGTGILMQRAAPPVLVTLRPSRSVTDRPDSLRDGPRGLRSPV